MVKTKRDRKEEWEREHVQRVLDYHNKKYGIQIKGRTTKVYPHLKRQLSWDWVCYDPRTGDEIALEVKKLTDTKSEERANIVWQLLEEVSDSLLREVPGTFFLSIDIPKGYYLPLNEQNKQELRNLLYELIYETAQRLKSGEEENLEDEILRRLSFKLRNDCSFTLTKLSDEGSAIYKSSGIIGWDSISFDELELEKFEQLVSYANTQLKVAHTDKTVLILIEEGFRPIDPPEIAEAFTKVKPESYSKIGQVYFIRGDEVTEIPLPPAL